MRNAIFIFIQLTLFQCGTKESYVPFEEATAHLRDSSLKPFYHGVASGDPTPHSVIIWTRVTPDFMYPEIKVKWEVSTDPSFQFLADAGYFTTGPDRDYTVKVDAQNLKSGTQYYYRFQAMEKWSPVGKTKTSPVDDSPVTFGVVSCSNYEFGYFNAYAALAREELDAVIHLGDYIYEYGIGGYGDTTIGRLNIPETELISLSDYRTRYSQYRLDPDLQAAHGAHPFIAIWDDHEITNDAYKDGGQNHQPEEGDYEVRKSAAVQTYYEWMPVREGEGLYRSFDFGQMADLIMLDERLDGRVAPVDSVNDPRLNASSQTMLGKTQRDWLLNQLSESNGTWKIIGNQVIFSYLNWGYEAFNINLDSWDGYPIERDIIADYIIENKLENIVFITGDTHSSWAFEVTHEPFDNYDQKTGSGAYALEFGTTSINSSNSNERFADSLVLLHEKKITDSAMNPHLKYSNLRDHGYLLMSFDSAEVTAEWKFVKTLKERNSEVYSGKVISAKKGTNKLNLFP